MSEPLSETPIKFSGEVIVSLATIGILQRLATGFLFFHVGIIVLIFGVVRLTFPNRPIQINMPNHDPSAS